MARAHGRGVMRPRRRNVPDSRAMGTRRGDGMDYRPRRRRRPVGRMVMPVRRNQERRQYRDDIGSRVVRIYAHATGIDAIGRDGNTAADGRPVIIAGTSGKSPAEQGGTEQGGEVLHGGLLAGNGLQKLPAIIHLN